MGRRPRPRRYNPCEPEASLLLFIKIDRIQSFDIRHSIFVLHNSILGPPLTRIDAGGPEDEDLRSCGLNLTTFQDLAPGADDDFFHGNRDTGQFHTFFDYHGECRATWNFHDHIGDAFDAGNFANL